MNVKGVLIRVEDLSPGDQIQPGVGEVRSVRKDVNGNYEVVFTNDRRTTVRPGTKFLAR